MDEDSCQVDCVLPMEVHSLLYRCRQRRLNRALEEMQGQAWRQPANSPSGRVRRIRHLATTAKRWPKPGRTRKRAPGFGRCGDNASTAAHREPSSEGVPERSFCVGRGRRVAEARGGRRVRLTRGDDGSLAVPARVRVSSLRPRRAAHEAVSHRSHARSGRSACGWLHQGWASWVRHPRRRKPLVWELRVENRKRDTAVTIRMSEEEHAMLKAIAEAKGLSVSDVVRQYVRREHEKLGKRAK